MKTTKKGFVPRKKRDYIFLKVIIVTLLFLSILFIINLYIDGIKIEKQIKHTVIKTDTLFIPCRFTVYNPTEHQCDETPFITADSSIINPINPKRWVGISRDLLKIFPFGSSININIPDAPYLNGVWEVHDTGSRRFKKSVDILISNPSVCNIRGSWNGNIYVINNKPINN